MGPLFLVTLSSGGLFILLIPAILINLALEERDLAIEMGLVGGLGAFVCVMIIAALLGRIRGVERELNFVSLVLIWVCTPLVAAVCLMVLAGLPPGGAWFEAVSALTTTGATVLVRDRFSVGFLFWRSSLEWYGGFLTLISIIHVLAPAGFGGLRPSGRRRGTSNHRDGHWGALSAYSSVLWQYGALTVVIALGLIFFSVHPGDAMMLAMVSIATGGFLPFQDPLDTHIGSGAMLVLAIGFCFGTLSVFWRRNILRSPRRLIYGNREATLVLSVIACLTLFYAAAIAESAGSGMRGIAAALLEGFFTAASLVSTSGIESRPGVIGLFPPFAVLLVIFIGASVYSTAGGIKYYRLASMWTYARAELNRLIYPSGISQLKFGRRHIDDAEIRAIWAYFVLALLCVALGTVLITLSAANFEGGLAMAISLFSGAGPVYDSLRPVGEGVASHAGYLSGWPAFADLPITAYAPAVVLMTIGRLEVLLVFAVINVSYWLNR
ncbi:potassium transporter TrkG [Pararhizobium haloflavum]|uniref:potassium transporter TrkG n=1 Tax=Pararhizobium haloflavum TaxID=2037914 RepID=UPI000C1826D0|nr:potassium transporter TrkG [Pararhizobium haloflavum]